MMNYDGKWVIPEFELIYIEWETYQPTITN